MYSNVKIRGLSGAQVHGGVVQVRAGSLAMVRWEGTAQKSESPPMPDVLVETKGVLTLNEGAIAPRLRTDRQSLPKHQGEEPQ